MGLYDREYMREDETPRMVFRKPRSGTTWLLIANVVAFVLQAIFYGYPPKLSTGLPLALNVDQLLHGYVWQLFTYQFLHGNLLHLLGNCLGIYMFAEEVEQALGKKRFFLLYFVSGAVGGVLQVLFSLAWHGHFGSTVVGASAGVFGIIAAFATMFPNRTLHLLLFFVLPVALKAKNLLLIEGALAIFGILFPGDNIGHAAHLGGALAAIVFIRQLRSRWGFWPGEQPPPEAPPKPIIEEKTKDEFIASEVDPILDKIAKKGIHSLNDRERKILETAKSRIEKR